ncbi:MAG: hypothetical protein JW999_04965 [Methanotrichaceae archaeon]|nr:hypothetical protein [Methanotrichaceae archaeon]
MFAQGAKSWRRIFLLASIILMLSIASSSEYPFASKVFPENSDIGRPLFSLPARTTVAFWDIGTPGYDESDPVYLHIGPSDGGTTNANDLRLTILGNLSAGSKVTFQDLDMNKPIEQLPSTICFLNINGSSAYDLHDPVYLHHFNYDDNSELDDCAPDMIAGFSERLPYRGREVSSHGLSYALFTDNYKLFISDNLIDKPKKVGEWRGLCIEMIRGLKADYYHILGTWLIKIQTPKIVAKGSCWASEPAGSMEDDPKSLFIRTNDIRLSSMEGLNAGTKVTNFDVDQNKLVAWPALAIFPGPAMDTTKMGFFDANGNGAYDYEDDVYLNVPVGVSEGVVTVNNVRLSGPI